MSGICGLFVADGGPLDLDLLERMSLAARHRGPDGCNSWTSGNVGLTQLLMATTPQAMDERSPFLHPETGSCIVFDGRIDNREDLISRLDPGGKSRRGDTDMELVLLAWLEWGTECPCRLLGDFSFAIYDGTNRTLFCARDISSIKPFYYAHKAGRFTFGSTVSQVLANPAVSTEPNEAMVAEILTGLHLSRTETLYRDILRLPAAHSLQVDRNGVKLRRYWHPSGIKPIRYTRFADYAAHFEEIFTEAVRCRLRSHGGVAVALSGGKDSPSIAGMAQSLLREAGSTKSLASYSLTFPGRPCDESGLIADVVARWNLDAHYYPFERFESLPDWAAQAELTRDLPESPTSTAFSLAHRQSVANGTRVWLFGTGSESVTGGSEFPYFALFRDRNFKGLAAEFENQARVSGLKYATLHCAASLLWPSFPRAVRKQLQATRHKFDPRGFASDEFLRSSKIDQRFASAQDAQDFDDLATWYLHYTAFSGERAFIYESGDCSNALEGIEERHPFEDRRLVEFSLAIPTHIKRSGALRKRLLASLGERLLPASVVANDDNAEVGCLFLDVLSREAVRGILDSARIVQRGWVSQTRLRAVHDRLCRQFRADPKSGWAAYDMADYRELSNLWTVVAVEFWLRQTLT